MIDLIQTIGQAIWFILPAYVANATPVLTGGGPPIDGGKKFSDGYRILGGGKTIRGFILGLLAGSIVGVVQFTFWSSPESWMIAVLLAFGALLGDLCGSFVKRRVGFSRGRSFPVLDQLEFVVGALLLASLIKVPGWEILAVLMILTPFIHLGTNFVGYKLGFKSEPY